MRHNLSSSLRRTRRTGNPMERFDALPAPLRAWLRQAALPWSPRSCERLWRRALRDGATTEAILERLNQAEAGMLHRDRSTLFPEPKGASPQDAPA